VLTPHRLLLLRTRGLLTVAVPRRPVVDVEQVRWLTAPPDVTRDDLCWYTDGSLVDGTWADLATAAAAIVVTTVDGALIAIAEIALPSCVRSASAAEAAAVVVVLSMCPAPPRTFTDCKVVVDATARGTVRATAASSPLAGYMRRAAVVVGDLEVLTRRETLVWIPAHLSRAKALAAMRSDGRPVCLRDWRANRLVDVVAKRAALALAVPRRDAQRVRIAAGLLRVEAGVLGVVTQAANNFKRTVVTASGASVTTVERDATRANARPCDVAARPWRKRCPAPPPEPRSVARGPLAPPSAQPRSAASVEASARRREVAVCNAASERFVLRELIAGRHSGATPLVSPSGDAPARFEALRARVAARAAASGAACSHGTAAGAR
jgi:hypothetical protein